MPAVSTKLMVRPGRQRPRKGQPLFVIEAADTVQAQNDFITAHDRLEQGKIGTRSRADTGHARQGSVRGQAVPLKDYQQTQAALIQGAERTLRSSQNGAGVRRATNCEFSA